MRARPEQLQPNPAYPMICLARASMELGGDSLLASKRLFGPVGGAILALSVIPALPGVQRAAAAVAGPEAAIRVDQVGYPATGPKVAYLMSSKPETGATAVVKDGAGDAVDTITTGASAGAWSRAYHYVYRLDFSSVVSTGSYQIVVSSPYPAQSPVFQIAPAESVYTQAMENSLSFYENERDGPSYIPSALRTAPAHLNDSDAMTYLTKAMNQDGGFNGTLTPTGVSIDASGGWFDAGDYLKFVETTSYVVAMMLTGVEDFPSQLGAGSGTSDFGSEARFGLDWLMKMWNEQTETLYYQVGVASGNRKTVGDHDIWRLPQADDTYGGTDPTYQYIRNRPVF